MEQLILKSTTLTREEFIREYYLDVDELPCKLMYPSGEYYCAMRDGVNRHLNIEHSVWEKFGVRFGYRKPKLCSSEVFHYYSHPLQAISFDHIHAQYLKLAGCSMLKVKPSGKLVSDGEKCGCTKITLLESIKMPIKYSWELLIAAQEIFHANKIITKSVDVLYDVYLQSGTL